MPGFAQTAVFRSEAVRSRPSRPLQDQPEAGDQGRSQRAHFDQGRFHRRDQVSAPPEKGEGTLDDIDHLGSRRIRTVGELLANQCRVGLARTERLVKERMTLFDHQHRWMTPQKLINPKALTAVIRDFFGRSPAFAVHGSDQSAGGVTHKRRLSALGPGGLAAIARASKSVTCILRITAAFARSRRRKVRTSAP